MRTTTLHDCMMKRKIWTQRRLFTGLISLIIGTALVVSVLPWWRQPAALSLLDLQADGSLRSTEQNLGQFRVVWDASAKQLRVLQQQQMVWQSFPAKGFVAAAQGQEMVREQRGSFFFEDHLTTTWSQQTLQSIARRNDTLYLSGQLRAAQGQAIGYVLAFWASGEQLHFSLHSPQGKANRWWLQWSSNAQEAFFGLGEQFTHFNLKGHRVPVWVSEQGIGRGRQPLTQLVDWVAQSGGNAFTTYIAVPFLMSSQRYALALQTYAYSVFDFREAHRVQVQVWGQQVAGQWMAGKNPASLIEQYTAQTGRMRPLPDWILNGAVLGLQGGTARVDSLLRLMEQYRIPVAGVWLQDWVGRRKTSFGKQLWWNWELDEQLYPQWKAFAERLQNKQIKVLTYCNPFLVDVSSKPNVRRNLLAEAQKKGYLVRDKQGQPLFTKITDFSAALVDLSNPEAYAWLKQVLQDNLLSTGAKGWMADFGEAFPYEGKIHSGEDTRLFHHRYPELWAKLNRELIDSQPDSSEYVFFMRAGYRLSPAYSTLFWLGDQMVSWDKHDGLKSSLTGLLSGGLSGFSLNHSDVGGYTAILNFPLNFRRRKELLWRWMELNAFSVVFRSHEGNKPDENFQLYSDASTLQYLSRCVQLYQAWADYRKQLVQEAAQTGLPVVRHLFIHYPDDAAVYSLTQQFLVGSELLVAPAVDEGQSSVRVYLPAGDWQFVWDDTLAYTGKQWVVVPAPWGQPPVFYKAGSAVGERFARLAKSAKN